MGDDHEYDVFISYHQGSDQRLASALRTALQQFAKPWSRRRALRVFLDKDSLEATATLGTSLEDKLRSTRHLVLLASRASAASPWCDHEVKFWVDRRGHDGLLLVLTDPGAELAWDPSTRSFDPDRTTALPPSLLAAYADQPLWIDMRWYAEEGQHQAVGLREPRFLDAVATLSASIRGVPKDALIGEDLREHRRLRRARRVAVASLAVLTAVALVAAAVALAMRSEAVTQRQLADARRLAAESESIVRQETDLAALLAAESLSIVSTSEGLDSLALVSTSPFRSYEVPYDLDAVLLNEDRNPLGDWIDPMVDPVPAFDPNDPPADVAVSDNGQFAATLWQDGRMQLTNAEGRELLSIADVRPDGSNAWRVDITEDGRIVGAVGGGNTGGWARFWNVATGAELGQTVIDAEELHAIGFDPGGDTVYLGGARGVLHRLDLETRDPTADWSDSQACASRGCLVEQWILDLDVAPDGRVAVATGSGAFVLDTAGSEIVATELPGDLSAVAVQFDDAGSVFVWYQGGTVKRFEFSPPPESTEDHDVLALSIDASADGHVVATGAVDGTIVVVDDRESGTRWEFPRDADLPESTKTRLLGTPLVFSVAVEADGRSIAFAATAFVGGSVVGRWDPGTGDTELLWDADAFDVAFLPDGQLALAVAPGGILKLVGVAAYRNQPQTGRIDLWDPSSGGTTTLTRFDELVIALDVGSDGRRVAAGTAAGSIHVIDLASAPERLEPSPVDEWSWTLRVRFSDDGRTVAASGNNGMVLLQDAGDPTKRRTLAGHTGWVRGLAFVADDTVLATAGSSDGSLRLWSVDRGLPLGSPRPAAGAATDVTVGAGGTLIVSTGDGGLSIERRQPRPEFGSTGGRAEFSGPASWPTDVCAIAGRNLTIEEWSTYIGTGDRRATCESLSLDHHSRFLSTATTADA